MSFAGKWMELEINLGHLQLKTKAQKTKWHMFSLICRTQTNNDEDYNYDDDNNVM
jgi:hypothetical protein